MSQSELLSDRYKKINDYNKLENVSQSERKQQGAIAKDNYNKLENVSQSELVIISLS